MAKEKIQLVKKEESKWYDLFKIVFSVILGLSGAFLVFKYLPDTEIIGMMIGFIAGLLLAKLVLWLLKKVIIIGIIIATGAVIFYFVKEWLNEWLRSIFPFF